MSLTCLACKYPGDYDQKALLWMKSEGIICEKHEKAISEVKTESNIPVKSHYSLFTRVLPSKPRRDYTEREPGQDDD